jgi:hypothetical protein
VKRARILGAAAFVATAAVLLVPMIAAGELPRPTQARIVPFQSIGPVELGTTKAKSFQKWGAADDCQIGTGGRDTCVWFANSSTDFPVEAGVLELKSGKVCGMYIRAGTNARDGSLSITRLKKWKTEEGVGLGSTLRAAKKVLGGKLIAEKHHVTTSFSPGTSSESRNQVEQIDIHKDGCNVT